MEIGLLMATPEAPIEVVYSKDDLSPFKAAPPPCPPLTMEFYSMA
jgi:hypothetical protein